MVGMYIWRKAYPRRRLNQKRATSLEWVPKTVRKRTSYADCGLVFAFLDKRYIHLWGLPKSFYGGFDEGENFQIFLQL